MMKSLLFKTIFLTSIGCSLSLPMAQSKVVPTVTKKLGPMVVPQPTADIIASGGKLFQTNCSVCHGEKGDGRGPAAVAIKDPKPRDFTSGNFKYGAEPRDIFKTITEGSPGTAMPPWNSLSEKERWALVFYLKSIKKTTH